MKNPDNRPLEIVDTRPNPTPRPAAVSDDAYAIALSNLAIAEAVLVKAGKQSALPHFIAVVKELEEVLGFQFQIK